MVKNQCAPLWAKAARSLRVVEKQKQQDIQLSDNFFESRGTDPQLMRLPPLVAHASGISLVSSFSHISIIYRERCSASSKDVPTRTRSMKNNTNKKKKRYTSVHVRPVKR